jgi:hypothetical protein
MKGCGNAGLFALISIVGVLGLVALFSWIFPTYDNFGGQIDGWFEWEGGKDENDKDTIT